MYTYATSTESKRGFVGSSYRNMVLVKIKMKFWFFYVTSQIPRRGQIWRCRWYIEEEQNLARKPGSSTMVYKNLAKATQGLIFKFKKLHFDMSLSLRFLPKRQSLKQLMFRQLV